MNRSKTGFIQYDEFIDLLNSWGFEATEDRLKELFIWLDKDQDNRISYEDLRSTAGLDITPQEALYFRQDVKKGGPVTCKYDGCWEHNHFNQKSQYCLMHQKIMREQCLDKFFMIGNKVSEKVWDHMVDQAVNANFTMSVKELTQMIEKNAKISYDHKDKEALWESFKIKANIEDNPDSLDDR